MHLARPPMAEEGESWAETEGKRYLGLRNSRTPVAFDKADMRR